MTGPHSGTDLVCWHVAKETAGYLGNVWVVYNTAGSSQWGHKVGGEGRGGGYLGQLCEEVWEHNTGGETKVKRKD